MSDIRNRGGQPNNKNAEKWTEEAALELGEKLLAWMRQGEGKNIYFNEFLHVVNDYPHSIVSKLSKKFDSFSGLIKKAKIIQEVKLLKYGGTDGCNASMAIFSLKNNHSYRDKQDVSTNTEPFATVILPAPVPLPDHNGDYGEEPPL